MHEICPESPEKENLGGFLTAGLTAMKFVARLVEPGADTGPFFLVADFGMEDVAVLLCPCSTSPSHPQFFLPFTFPFFLPFCPFPFFLQWLAIVLAQMSTWTPLLAFCFALGSGGLVIGWISGRWQQSPSLSSLGGCLLPHPAGASPRALVLEDGRIAECLGLILL